MLDPSGPPESLLKSDVIDELSKIEYQDRAIKVFKKVGDSGPEGENYLNILVDKGWPTPQEYQVDEGEENDKNPTDSSKLRF